MTTGASSLTLVRDELFTTMGETEQNLEYFISERQNGSYLQRAVEGFQQIRGTLNLIEMDGAELLAQELYELATEIPMGAGDERNEQLTALSNGLYVLGRHLEQAAVRQQELPELLVPAINALREQRRHVALPEGFFFSTRLDVLGADEPLTREFLLKISGVTTRLCHVYRVGLLAVLKSEDPRGFKAMAAALARMHTLLGDKSAAGRLCWVALAVLEAFQAGELHIRKARKLLLCRLERELKRLTQDASYHLPRNMLKDLLYLVALADSQQPAARAVYERFALATLPFDDSLIEREHERLVGPGVGVMRSLSTAINEELASLKDLMDLIGRGSADVKSGEELVNLLVRLSKTLTMVGMSDMAALLTQQASLATQWIGESPSLAELHALADAVLTVESSVSHLGADLKPRPADEEENEDSAYSRLQQIEARIVVLDEAKAGLALTRRAITAYVESAGDPMHVANVPATLQTVWGGLWFLGDQNRLAYLVQVYSDFIQKQLIDSESPLPTDQQNLLADALASLEYYLEGGPASGIDTARAGVLDMAAESLRQLGCQVSEQ